MAYFIGTSEKTALDHMKCGKLPGFRIGRLWRVRLSDLIRDLETKIRAQRQQVVEDATRNRTDT